MAESLSIAVVEDNDDLRESLVEVLGAHGHQVSGVASAEELADLALAQPFSLIVLDLNLPGEDGLSLAMRLKRVQPRLRVIMMTTRTAVDDRVRGYESGADLYLPKPVAERELLAAVHAMARQIASGIASTGDAAGPVLQLDEKRLRLHGLEGSVELSAREAALLRLLAIGPGQRLEYWQLLQGLGMSLDEQGKSTLAVTVTRLRQKLQQLGCNTAALRSLRLAGYQLCVPLELA